MYKNNSRDSSKIKACSPLQRSCNLTEKYHAVGYYSYTHRCHQYGCALMNMLKNPNKYCFLHDFFVNLKKKEMLVERQNNEIFVRFSAGLKTSKIQTILDYLRYEELTSKSTATEEDVNELLKEVKKGRWNRTKEELGLND